MYIILCANKKNIQMKKFRIIFILIISIVSFFIFSGIEFEPLNQVTSKYLQAFIFSATLAVSIIKPSLRLKLFYLGFLLIFLMVCFYLFGRLPTANSFASIGIGILLIVSLTYLPELFRKGFVEKL